MPHPPTKQKEKKRIELDIPVPFSFNSANSNCNTILISDKILPKLQVYNQDENIHTYHVH